MKTKYLILCIIAFIILIAAITNPDEAKHKEAVKAKLTSFLAAKQSEMAANSDDVFAQAGMSIGSMIGLAFVDQMVSTFVSEDNYVLFSLTKINLNGESRIIGIGAFGNVFLTSKIDEALKGSFDMDHEKQKEDREKMDSLYKAASGNTDAENENK